MQTAGEYAYEIFNENFDDGTLRSPFNWGSQITDGKLMLTKIWEMLKISYFTPVIAKTERCGF